MDAYFLVLHLAAWNRESCLLDSRSRTHHHDWLQLGA